MAAQEIIDASRAYAQGWVDQADQLVENLTIKIEAADDKFGLGKTVTVFDRPAIDISSIEAIPLAENYDAATKLSANVDSGERIVEEFIDLPEQIKPPSWSDGILPDQVQFDADKYTVDPFSKEAPIVDFGNAPAAFTDKPPAKSFTVSNVSIPTSFTVATPRSPTLLGAINLPSAPAVQFPQSLGVIDWSFVDDVGDAAFGFTFNDAAYKSAMLDSVTAKLLADLANGGYGIETDDEAGLWERGREREDATSQAEMQAITRDFASRGFMAPPGALFGALEGIRAKAMAAASTLSREVALKRADLYVQNRQFTIQQVKELEGVLLNQHMAIMERVLKAAQISAQFVVDQYRAKLDKAKAQADVVQLRVQSFRDLVAAESSKIEVYNAQIRAELAKTEVDKNKIDAYRAQLAGVESTVNVYRLQVQAAEAAIQAERSKVEIWKAEVDGYLASVKAKEAEFSGYEARIRGEQAKVQAFSEEVRAHTAMVDAKRVEADIKGVEVRAYAEASNIALRAFEAELGANKHANELVSRAHENAVREYDSRVRAYGTQVDAAGKLASTQIDQSRLIVDSRIQAAKLLLEATLAEITADFKATGFVVESQQKLVDMYKDMIGASLGALNSIASISE